MTEFRPAGDGVRFRCRHCGGDVSVYMSGEFAHTWPPCPEFDAVQDFADAADFLAAHRVEYTAN